MSGLSNTGETPCFLYYTPYDAEKNRHRIRPARIHCRCRYLRQILSLQSSQRPRFRKERERTARAAEVDADRILQSRISRLQQLGILGDQIAESKADTCYIESMGAGLQTLKWEQFCELYYAVGHTALLSRSEAFARIEAASLRKEDPTFPGHFHPSNRSWCEYESSAQDNVIYVLVDSIPDDHECGIPDLIGGIGHFGAGRPGSTKFDYTFDPDTIDQSVNLIWITVRHRYYRENIGCTPDPFCSSSPRSTPIQAD